MYVWLEVGVVKLKNEFMPDTGMGTLFSMQPYIDYIIIVKTCIAHVLWWSHSAYSITSSTSKIMVEGYSN